MQNRSIRRFALLGALLSTLALSAAPALAQKDQRTDRGTAKEDRNREDGQNRNKEGRGGSGSSKSEGHGDNNSKPRKDRR